MPAPKTLLALHIASLVVSIALLILGLCDEGLASCWCTTICSFTILIYHSVVLVMTCTMLPDDDKPYASITCICAASILGLFWFACYAVMIAVSCAQVEKKPLHVVNILIHIPRGERNLQRWQFLCVPVGWTLLGDLAIRTTIYRRQLRRKEVDGGEDLPEEDDEIARTPTTTTSSNVLPLSSGQRRSQV